VGHHGKDIHVGNFDSIEAAEAAVRARRRELFTHNDVDRVAASDPVQLELFGESAA
jgi:hypothetical protein